MKEKEPLKEEYSILAVLALIFGFVFYPVGLILGIVALVDIKNNPHKKGKILAWIGILVPILVIVLIIILGLGLGFIRGMLG